MFTLFVLEGACHNQIVTNVFYLLTNVKIQVNVSRDLHQQLKETLQNYEPIYGAFVFLQLRSPTLVLM